MMNGSEYTTSLYFIADCNCHRLTNTHELPVIVYWRALQPLILVTWSSPPHNAGLQNSEHTLQHSNLALKILIVTQTVCFVEIRSFWCRPRLNRPSLSVGINATNPVVCEIYYIQYNISGQTSLLLIVRLNCSRCNENWTHFRLQLLSGVGPWRWKLN
jgi:hypothetical protein